MIEFRNVHKNLGGKPVLPGLSLTAQAGRMTVLLGPNGAGKTTALKLILGLIPADQGSIHVLERNAKDPILRKTVGYVPQELSFPSYLRTIEVLQLTAGLHSRALDEQTLERFSLREFMHHRAEKLSGGQKRRLGLATAFLSEPKLLILDEPTTGLDLESKVWLWRLLQDFVSTGGTLLLTTHDIYEISVIDCDGILLNRGQVVASGPMESILARARLKKVSFRCRDLSQLGPWRAQLTQSGEWHRLWTKEPEDFLKAIFLAGCAVEDLQIERGGLDEILLAMGGKLLS